MYLFAETVQLGVAFVVTMCLWGTAGKHMSHKETTEVMCVFWGILVILSFFTSIYLAARIVMVVI